MLKEVSIEILRKCPNHCIHCSSFSDESCQESLPYELFTSIAADAVKLGAKVICFSGGEPFLHPELLNMVDFAHSLGLKSYIYTSGITFDPQGKRRPLEKNILQAIAEKVSKIIFNIEAGDPKTYDRIMGTTDCFDFMKQSVMMAVNLNIFVEAHFVPMRINIDQIERVLRLCKQLGVKRISFLRLVLHGRAQENAERLALSDMELQDFKHDLECLRKKSSTEVRIGVPLLLDLSCHKCEAAVGKLNIRYDGKVFPCEVFKNGRVDQMLAGTLPESIYERSLLDIYRNSLYLQRVRVMSAAFSQSDRYETCIGQHILSKTSKDGG